MNASTPEIAGIVLAGGQGRRMGGRDKGLLSLGGRPLISWVIDRVAPQIAELVISANRNLGVYAALGYPVVTDLESNFPGPLAGILAASRHVSRDWLLVVPCDTPFLPLDLASRMRDLALSKNVPLVRAADARQTHYAVCLLHRRLLTDLAAYLTGEGRRLAQWQARHPCAEAVFVHPPTAFLNVNGDTDLRQAEALVDLR